MDIRVKKSFHHTGKYYGEEIAQQAQKIQEMYFSMFRYRIRIGNVYFLFGCNWKWPN